VFESTQNGRTDIWELKEKDGFLQGADGKPEQLTDGPLNFFDPISSKDRRELFAIGVLPRAELVRYDLLTHQFSPYLSGISVEGVDFSRDGAWVTYVSYPEGTLWRSRVDGSDRLQLTFQSMRVLLPRWSPDGKQIAFMGSPPSSPWKLGGPWKIYLVPAQGGTPRQLQPGELNEADPTWSPDGNSIAFGRLPGPGNSAVNSAALDIQVIDLKTGKLSKLLGSDGLFSPRWSPDGRYVVAFTASHPTAPKLFDFATLKWTQLASTEMGYPSWSHDGKFIYMQDWNRGRPRIVRLRLRDRKLEVIMDFAQVERNMAGTIIPWSGVALDGSPLLARDISNSEIYRLSLRAR
jgi:Tol biopolymer transport system component